MNIVQKCVKFVHQFLSVFSCLLLYAGFVYAENSTVEFKSAQPSNIFLGNKAKLEIKINRSNSSLNKMGLIEIKDEEGNLVDKSSVDLHADHSTIEVSGLGYYSVELFEVGEEMSFSKVLGKTTVAVLPEIGNDPKNPFGLWHVHGDLKMGLKAGAHWTRLLRTIKSYSLDESGKVISRPPAKRIVLPVFPGYSLIDTLSYGLPDFLKNKGDKSDRNLYPPKDWVLFEQLVEQFARDFAYEPEYFSVYNEPENFWQGTDQELFRFLDTIAQVFKRVHPHTKVLGPGFATIKVSRLRNLARMGLFDHLDGFVTNAYAEVGAPEDEFIGRVRELKRLFSEIGRPAMPIYITEYGWASLPGVTWQKPVDELTQAQYVARSLALLRSEGVDAAIYFCLRFNGNSADALGFSVTHSDGTPKPAYVAFATASRMIGHDGVPSLHEGDDGVMLFQLRARNNGESVVVVWRRSSNESVFIPGEFAKRMVDIMGRSLNVTENYKIGASPVYFVPKTKLDDIPKVFEKQIIKRGSSVRCTISQSVYIPKPLRLEKMSKQIIVPEDTSPGTYWLVSDADKRISVFPVVVTE